ALEVKWRCPDLGQSNLVRPLRVNHNTRQEQRHEVFYPKTCLENQGCSGVLRPGDYSRAFADGRHRLLRDLALFQEDFAESGEVARGLAALQGDGAAIRGVAQGPCPRN